MTPEAPGNLMVIDVSESDDGDVFGTSSSAGIRLPDSREFLWTLWAAEEWSEGGIEAAGGAVCVAADAGVAHARYYARPRSVRTRERRPGRTSRKASG